MATIEEEKKRKEMTYGEQMSALGTALANIPKHIVSAPGYGLDSPAFQSKPKPAAAPAVAPPSTPGPSIDRVAPAAAPATPGYDYNGGPATMPPAEAGSGNLGGLDGFRTGGGDIRKTVDAEGRTTYSGTNIGPGATINNREPGGGNVSNGVDSGAASAQRVADIYKSIDTSGGAGGLQGFGMQTPQVRHSGNDWQARTDLRNAMVGASTLTNERDRNPRSGMSPAEMLAGGLVMADRDARGAAAKLPGQVMKENAGLQREALQQIGQTQRDTARYGLDAARLRDNQATSALERERLGLQLEGDRQIGGLRGLLLDPNSTPEQRKQAQASLLALQGKQENANRYTVVPGGQQIDQASGRAYTVPSQVLDNQTGGWVQGQGQGGAPAAQPSANHIAALKANPAQAAMFDEIYGAGAAKRVLG